MNITERGQMFQMYRICRKLVAIPFQQAEHKQQSTNTACSLAYLSILLQQYILSFPFIHVYLTSNFYAFSNNWWQKPKKRAN
jgi:hypothetical protein